MMDIENLLKEYKNISNDIITNIQIKNFDKLNELLDEREKIIKMLSTTNLQDYSDKIKNLGILEIEEEIKNRLHQAQSELKSEIKKIKEQKKLNNIYNKKEQVDSLFVYKKF